MSEELYYKHEYRMAMRLLHAILTRYHPDGVEISETMLEDDRLDKNTIGQFKNPLRGSTIFFTAKEIK